MPKKKLKKSILGTQYDWILGQPVITDNINYEWILGQPYIIHEITAVVSPNLTDRNNYNGYLAFIQQYIKHKINGTTPWKNPDGTLLE